MINQVNHSKLIIIGAGPAGLTAGIYAGRAELSPIIFTGDTWGGQLMMTTDVENYPGFPDGIMGPDLMEKMSKQAEKFGSKLIYSAVEKVDFSNKPFKVYSEGQEYTTDSIIIATGSKARWLNIDKEIELIGKGVSACATCDAAFFKEKKVAIVGGGDTAMEEALFLTKFAKEVVIIHRRNEFRASKIMQQRVLNHPKITVVWNSEVSKLNGDEKITADTKLHTITLKDTVNGDTKDLNIDGLFVAIGHEPQTILFQGIINIDSVGYIVPTDEHRVKTNIEGIFVAGDVSDSRYRQAVVAAGFGAMTAIEVEHYLQKE